MLLKYLIIPEFPSKSVNSRWCKGGYQWADKLNVGKLNTCNLGACMENIYENIYLEKLLLTIVFISLMFAS